MDPEGRTVKISSGKRSAACEEWMRNRRICGKLTIDTAVFIYKMLGQKSCLSIILPKMVIFKINVKNKIFNST